ncbi:MAG: HAD family phosphatase [Patescibacteria group bacterium]
MIKAVIFDFDGVIIDSEPLNDLHFPKYLKKIGINVPPDFLEKFKGTSSKTQWTHLIEKYKLTKPMDKLILESSASYLEYIKSIPDLKPIKGLIELLEILTENKIKIALASSASKKRIFVVLDKLKIANYFPITIGADDITHGKPNPEVFLLAAKKMSVFPSDCLVIEDSTNGVLAAKNAGMKCIGFADLPYNKQDLSDADIIVKSLNQINWNLILTI